MKTAISRGFKMKQLDYALVRSRRRTLALQVERDGSLTVRAPLRCPNAAIEAFVAKNAAPGRRKSVRRFLREMKTPGADSRAARRAFRVRKARYSHPCRALRRAHGRLPGRR